MSDSGEDLSRRDVLQTVAALAALNALGATATPASACSTLTASPAATGTAAISVSRYIHRRLKQHGCNVLFGIPGKTCEHRYDQAAAEQMRLCVTASDLRKIVVHH